MRPLFEFYWMWISSWIKLSWHSFSVWDKLGWINWFWQFLCEELSSFNLKGFYYSKWMWSCVCPIRNMTACKVMEDTAIMGLPSDYSICPSQLKYQIKFWLKANVLYEQLSHMQQYVYLLCIMNNPSITLVKSWYFLSNLISFSL